MKIHRRALGLIPYLVLCHRCEKSARESRHSYQLLSHPFRIWMKDQTTFIARSQWSNDWACARFKHFRGQFQSLSRFITQNFYVDPSPLETTRAISLLSPIILPLQTFFSRGLLLRQQAFPSRNLPREADDNNYSDKNTSLYVSLRTRKFDKKIHYCCRDSFFVEEDI